ncbi:MAG: hypothetical protein U0166_23175 [Acidobacteriota bacterium]
MIPLVTHAFYLATTIGFTIWVAHTLHANGRAFLVETFHGNVRLADAVNTLLVVGFYLVNVGYVALAVKLGARAYTLERAVEMVSTKAGYVLLLLGVMHFFNLFVFAHLRRRAAGGA